MNFFTFTVADQRELFVSQNGHDNESCGHESPCLTIGYTLEHRANNDDIIKIDNQCSENRCVFNINKTLPFKQNLTLKGINGKPVIFSTLQRFLFDDKELLVNYTTITLVVINIWFKQVALSQLTRAPYLTTIKVLNCQISDIWMNTFYDLPFIHSENNPHVFNNRNSSIVIIMDDSIMFNFSSGIKLSRHNLKHSGLNVRLRVTNSSFSNWKMRDVLGCSTFAKINFVLSLKADFLGVNFANVSLNVDTSTSKSSVISISKGIFISGCVCLDVNGATLNVWSSTLKLTRKDNSSVLTTATILSSVNALFDSCHFVNDADNYNIMDRYSMSKVRLNHCTFRNNWRIMAGIMGVPGGTLVFKNCTFINNSVSALPVKGKWAIVNYLFYKFGGAVYISQSSATFIQCRFLHNRAIRGGAVYVTDSAAVFDNCYFEDNFSDDTGGAIFQTRKSVSDTDRRLIIHNSFFKGNKAATGGSAVWNERGYLIAVGSIFYTSFYYNKHEDQTSTGVSCFYSSSPVKFSNVSVIDIDTLNMQSNLITSSLLQTFGNSVKMQCNHGKDIAVHGTLDGYGQGFNALNVFCSVCPPNTYSFAYGKVVFKDSSTVGPALPLPGIGYNVRHIKCLRCPFGAVCKNGQIHSASNFWGYSSNNQEVHFLTCPFGYCCHGRQCKSYDSCALGRHGILCSLCDEDRTENVFTPDCLEPITCSHPWLWFVLIFGGIIYFLGFMYMKEIVILFQAILFPRGLENAFKRTELNVPSNETPLLTNDQTQGSPESYDTAESVRDGKSVPIFPGLFEIVVYFYQVNVLYKVQGMSETMRSPLGLTKEILSTVFSLRTDGLFYKNFSWCPFKNLQPVPKVLFKMSFIFYLLLLVLLTHIITRIWNLRKKNIQSNQIILRLLPTGLRLILIGYATVTTAFFSLLSCIPLNDMEHVLFVDGSIKCYQWWQFIIILIVICWVVSFPISIYSSSWLLHKKMMSVRMFVVSLFFPCVAIMYWLHSHLRVSRKQPGTELSDTCAVSEEHEERSSLQKEVSQELLNVIEGPFRKSESTNHTNNYRLPWESILIARRLILIVIKTFVPDTVVRLYVMLLFSVLFLAHQVKVQPFSSTILNHVESVSLLMLVVVCGLNTIPAYNYMYPLSVSPFAQGLITAYSSIETALTLIFPAILLVFLTVLVCVRICQFISWLCGVIIRVIRICMKPKSL